MGQRHWTTVKIQESDKRSVGEPWWQGREASYSLKIPKLWTTQPKNWHSLHRGTTFCPKTGRRRQTRTTNCGNWLARIYGRKEIGEQHRDHTSWFWKRNAKWGGDRAAALAVMQREKKQPKMLSYEALGEPSVVNKEMLIQSAQLDDNVTNSQRLQRPWTMISTGCWGRPQEGIEKRKLKP